MSQISLPEAADLLEKLLSERIPLKALFASTSSGARMQISGFVDSAMRANGLIVSVSGPPIDVNRGWIHAFPFDRECEFWYGEKREFPEEVRLLLSDSIGESTLVMRFPQSGEVLALFFTV